MLSDTASQLCSCRVKSSMGDKSMNGHGCLPIKLHIYQSRQQEGFGLWAIICWSLLYGTEKALVTHSSTLAWKIPWAEEPGRLQSMGSIRVRHDWETSLSLFTFMHWRRKWQPTPMFLPGESQGREAWWAAVYGVAQSQTRLKQLSSSSSSPRNRPVRMGPGP